MSFQTLQQHGPARFYAFDLLVRDSADVMSWPIEERRAQLEEPILLVLAGPPGSERRIVRHISSPSKVVERPSGDAPPADATILSVDKLRSSVARRLPAATRAFKTARRESIDAGNTGQPVCAQNARHTRQARCVLTAYASRKSSASARGALH